jgi:hypothetical protein
MSVAKRVADEMDGTFSASENLPAFSFCSSIPREALADIPFSSRT